MSDSDGAPTRYYDANTGHQVNPEGLTPGSPPVEGAGTEGAPPAPQTQDTRHEPPVGSPRWNEVYRQAKEGERRIAELEQQLAEREFGQTYDQPPAQPEPTQAAGQQAGDEWGEFKAMIREAVREEVGPVKQELNQQRQVSALDRQRQALRERYGEAYDPMRDDAQIGKTAQQFGITTLEGAFRATFPERVAQAAMDAQVGEPAAPQAAPPPVANVPGGSPQAPAESAEALYQEFLQTPDKYRKQELAARLSDMGAWGARDAEAALGLG